MRQALAHEGRSEGSPNCKKAQSDGVYTTSP